MTQNDAIISILDMILHVSNMSKLVYLKDVEILLNLSKQHKMQGRKGKCKDKKENARTT